MKTKLFKIGAASLLLAFCLNFFGLQWWGFHYRMMTRMGVWYEQVNTPSTTQE